MAWDAGDPLQGANPGLCALAECHQARPHAQPASAQQPHDITPCAYTCVLCSAGCALPCWSRLHWPILCGEHGRMHMHACLLRVWCAGVALGAVGLLSAQRHHHARAGALQPRVPGHGAAAPVRARDEPDVHAPGAMSCAVLMD